jgi:AcrR family transcriptional regulator
MTKARAPRKRVAAAKRRQLILEAAGNLFLHRPYKEVTTRVLADAAGVSEALLFQHFGTKRDLYAAVVEAGVGHVTDRLTDVFTSVAELPEATLERIEEIFAGALAFWFGNPGFLQSFLTEPDADEMRRTYYQVLLDQEAAMLPHLQAARDAGVLPDIDPRVLLRALLGQALVFVVTEEWLGGKDLGPLDRSTLPRELARLWAGLLGASKRRGIARPRGVSSK